MKAIDLPLSNDVVLWVNRGSHLKKCAVDFKLSPSLYCTWLFLPIFVYSPALEAQPPQTCVGLCISHWGYSGDYML